MISFFFYKNIDFPTDYNLISLQVSKFTGGKSQQADVSTLQRARSLLTDGNRFLILSTVAPRTILVPREHRRRTISQKDRFHGEPIDRVTEIYHDIVNTLLCLHLRHRSSQVVPTI